MQPQKVILLINFFKGVPESLDEAARIDGAGPITVLLKVYLPISLPALATVGLFAIVNHWNDYFSGLSLPDIIHVPDYSTLVELVENDMIVSI